jgi:hypothetical protein
MTSISWTGRSLVGNLHISLNEITEGLYPIEILCSDKTMLDADGERMLCTCMMNNGKVREVYLNALERTQIIEGTKIAVPVSTFYC